MNVILKGREDRVKERNHFIKMVKRKYDITTISFVSVTINLPGRNKKSEFILDLFNEAIRILILEFFKKNIIILEKKV